MTDLEIDRRLALAIGYAPEYLLEQSGGLVVWRGSSWFWFSHQQPRTIYPIAEHFKMMPQWNTQYNQWTIALVAPRGSMPSIVFHDCPATCIALAVIEASERGLLS